MASIWLFNNLGLDRLNRGREMYKKSSLCKIRQRNSSVSFGTQLAGTLSEPNKRGIWQPLHVLQCAQYDGENNGKSSES